MARAAATGGGRTYRGQRPLKWYASLALIAVLGVGLVWYSRYERQHPSSAGQPTTSTKWASGISFDICGVTEPNLPTNPNATSSKPPGIATEGDGVIHIAPRRASEEGANATLGLFVAEYPGLELTSASVRYPGKTTKAAPTVGRRFQDGTACPKGTPDAGKHGTLTVEVWPNFNNNKPVRVGDPVDYKLANDQLITVAFVPYGSKIPKPGSSIILAMLQAGSGTSTSSTVPNTATTTTPTGATTTPSTTAATSTTSSTATTAASSTTTTTAK